MLDFVGSVRQESARFVEVLADVPAGTRVPTCPDWDVDDLLWHLTDVQWFWGEVVQRRAVAAEDVGEHPVRPEERAGLLVMFERVSARLHDQLVTTPAQTSVWMWARDHRNAGYIARRQAHEALIHRVDAELTAGTDRRVLDPVLAADGVDEMLRIMAGECPDGAELQPGPAGRWLRIVAEDALDADGVGRSWLLLPSRLVGTSPAGEPIEESAGLVPELDDGRAVAATVSGAAADLDCLLWNRPPLGEVRRRGDPVALAAFEELLG